MVRHSGLGKGLDALIPSDLLGGSSDSPFQDLDISLIVPNRYQPRTHFDEETLAALASSISDIGVIQPIVVREIEEGYEIIVGERRWRASQRAGLTKIPALVRAADDRITLELAVVENLQRQDLNALEEAVAFRQLMDDFGLSQSEVASRVGRSRSAVANTIRLLNLPAAVQSLVVEGSLTPGHGRALLAVEGDEARIALAEEIVRENLTVRETERRAADARPHTTEPEAEDSESQANDEETSEMEAGILELEDLLSTRLETQVKVQMTRGKGKITIRFAGLSDLERIYNVIV